MKEKTLGYEEWDNVPFGRKNLRDYIYKADGISFFKLNVFAFVGLFVFGWLLVMVYEDLGKKKLGWGILVSLVLCLSAGKINIIFLSFGGLIYLIGWIYANFILYSVHSLAKKRIHYTDRTIKPDINLLLEKGILLGIVLKNKNTAIKILSQAIKHPGGDKNLLFWAGAVMNRCDQDGQVFWDRSEKIETAK